MNKRKQNFNVYFSFKKGNNARAVPVCIVFNNILACSMKPISFFFRIVGDIFLSKVEKDVKLMGRDSVFFAVGLYDAMLAVISNMVP